MDWKKILDRDAQRQKNERKRSEQLRIEQDNEALRLETENREREHQRRVTEHKKTFYCYLCGTPSKGPYYFSASSGSNGGAGGGNNPTGSRHSGHPAYYNYSMPTGLYSCKRCRQLTCEGRNCSQNGICRKCSEHLYNR